MKHDLDSLLQDNFLHVPVDFTQQVMQRVQLLPQRSPVVLKPARVPAWAMVQRMAAWGGLIGGGLLGLSQMAGFVLALWLTTPAV